MVRSGMLIGSLAAILMSSASVAEEAIADTPVIDGTDVKIGTIEGVPRPITRIGPKTPDMIGSIAPGAEPQGKPENRKGVIELEDGEFIPVEEIAASRNEPPDDRESSGAAVDGWTGLLGQEAPMQDQSPSEPAEDWTAEFR